MNVFRRAVSGACALGLACTAQAGLFTVDPTAYAPGTDISVIHPGTTLSVAQGYVKFVDFDPTPTLVETIRLTGPDLGPILAQGPYLATGNYLNWASDPYFGRYEVFKATFSVPVTFVAMSFHPDDTDTGVLGVFDDSGTLISHQYLRSNQDFTLSFSSGSTRIGYILAGSADPAYLTTLSYNVGAVPEPGTYMLMTAGLALLVVGARRRRS